MNCMYYIKCGVNSLLLTWFWLLRNFLWHLGSLFYHDTQYSQREWLMHYKFTFVGFRETRHHAQAYVTAGALIDCALSLAARRTQTAEELGWFCWPVFVKATSAEAVPLLLLLHPPPPPVPQNSLLTSLAFAPDSEPVSATRISLMAERVRVGACMHARVCVLCVWGGGAGGWAVAGDPQLSALFRLLCMTAQFQKCNTSEIWMSSTMTAKQIYSYDVTAV